MRDNAWLIIFVIVLTYGTIVAFVQDWVRDPLETRFRLRALGVWLLIAALAWLLLVAFQIDGFVATIVIAVITGPVVAWVLKSKHLRRGR